MTTSPSDYLFRFGYCTPEQWTANETHGWDDESSGAFFVRADSPDRALLWGRTVADAFVRRLFEAAGKEEISSWCDAQFASWIEPDPDSAFPREFLITLARVNVGEMPSFDGW